MPWTKELNLPGMFKQVSEDLCQTGLVQVLMKGRGDRESWVQA